MSDPEESKITNIIIDNDVNQLKNLYDEKVEIKFSDYVQALEKTNGDAIKSTECIKFLHEIGIIHIHQVMLDAAMMGNQDLMKYAQSKGEDLFYYKVILYILMRPDHPCKEFILRELRLSGQFPDESIQQFAQREVIDEELASKLHQLPNGTLFTKFTNFYNKYHWILPSIAIGLSSIWATYHLSKMTY